MKFLYIFLVLFCLVVSVGWGMSQFIYAAPTECGNTFLSAVRSGDSKRAIAMFGDNNCNCPPKGGYASLLQYESGLIPNMTFLLGHPFQFQYQSSQRTREKGLYVIPWEKPEGFDVQYKLVFSEYRPLLLPLPLAYGQEMKQGDFDAFVADPSKEIMKGFSLRLRPDICQGTIKNRPLTDAEQLLPEATRRYAAPKDCAAVVTDSGEKLTAKQVQERLPHLQEVTLKLHIVRRGQLHDWMVQTFQFSNPQLVERAS
jgi:hypothetical protein